VLFNSGAQPEFLFARGAGVGADFETLYDFFFVLKIMLQKSNRKYNLNITLSATVTIYTHSVLSYCFITKFLNLFFFLNSSVLVVNRFLSLNSAER